VSVGGFVPKPHTPFQWFGQNGVDEMRRKINLVRDACRGTRAQVKWHDSSASFAEGIASRGDRRVGRVIERVWRAGGTFQEWSSGSGWIDGSARWPPGLDQTGTYPASHEDGSCRGITIAPGCIATSCAGLAGGASRARAPRLPVDALLRLRGVHRLRPRARGGLVGGAGGREPGTDRAWACRGTRDSSPRRPKWTEGAQGSPERTAAVQVPCAAESATR
jgi:hypothetical protein